MTAQEARDAVDGVGPQTCRLVWLRPGAEQEYERLHRELPAEIGERLRLRGVHDYSIFRHGSLLINVLRQGPPILPDAELDGRLDRAHTRWQATLAPLFSRTLDDAGAPIMADRVFRWE